MWTLYFYEKELFTSNIWNGMSHLFDNDKPVEIIRLTKKSCQAAAESLGLIESQYTISPIRG